MIRSAILLAASLSLSATPQGTAHDGIMVGLSSTGGPVTGDLQLQDNVCVAWGDDQDVLACFDPAGPQWSTEAAALTSDVVPPELLMKPASAWEGASVNDTGADLLMVPGFSTKQIAVDDFSLCSGDTVTVRIGATNSVLTEGVDWTAATDNDTTASSLASAVDLISGVTGSSALAIVRIATTGTDAIGLAESDVTCTTITLNLDGQALIGGGGRPQLAHVSDMDTGIRWRVSRSDGSGADGFLDIMTQGTARATFQATGDLQLSADITMNGNLVTDSTGPLQLGTAATTTHSLVAGDVIVGAALEVDGMTSFDSGWTIFTGDGRVNDNRRLQFGSGGNANLQYETEQTPDSWVAYTSADSRAIIVSEQVDDGTDFSFPLQTNPTICIQSADATTPAQRLYFAHDQTDGVITSETGGVKLITELAKGRSRVFSGAEETLTFAGGGGDASKTTSGLIPDGAFFQGAVVRVTTAGTTCTSMSIGDGSDDDIFGFQIAVTDNTTTTFADFTANISNPQFDAAEVTVTGVGGNCVDLVVNVTAYYEIFTAQTSD